MSYLQKNYNTYKFYYQYVLRFLQIFLLIMQKYSSFFLTIVCKKREHSNHISENASECSLLKPLIYLWQIPLSDSSVMHLNLS